MSEGVPISEYWERDKRKLQSRLRGLFNKVQLMPRICSERDEDWMVTCPECHGRGTIGVDDSRKRCPKM